MRFVALQYVIRNGEHNLIYGHIRQINVESFFLGKRLVRVLFQPAREFGIVNTGLKAGHYVMSE